MDYPPESYPLLCLECAHCQRTIKKDSLEEPWTDAHGGTQCEEAPNPEDGPMPGHEPGGFIVGRPTTQRSES